MIADVCDEDELATGKRREGSYQAVYNWWWKIGMSGAFFRIRFLLRSTGFNEKLLAQFRFNPALAASLGNRPADVYVHYKRFIAD